VIVVAPGRPSTFRNPESAWMTTLVTPAAAVFMLRGDVCLQSSSNGPPASADPAPSSIIAAIAVFLIGQSSQRLSTRIARESFS
jgi:hypothetical protein